VTNKRQHPRFACDVQAELRLPGQVLPVRAVDISRGGICLLGDQQAALGVHVGVALTLILRSGQHSERLVLPARIIWSTPLRDGHQIGCKFAELSAADTQYLETFLRFVRGEVRATADDGEAGEPDDDPDSEPFA